MTYAPIVFPYGPQILWEPPLQTIARMFLRPDQHVIDVGANIGALSIAFARLVGPRGRVLAFECNPSLNKWAADNIEVNGFTSVVELEGTAAFSRAREKVSFFCEPSPYGSGSSLVALGEDASHLIEVETATIDGECAARGLRPRLIKIDVEGAEIDVLMGSEKTIRNNAPVILFERQTGLAADRDPLPWLIERCYAAHDINTLRSVPAE
jgi:FkbM family methyltransferase